MATQMKVMITSMKYYPIILIKIFYVNTYDSIDTNTKNLSGLPMLFSNLFHIETNFMLS